MRTETMPMEQLAQLLEVQLQEGVAPLRVTGVSMYPTFRNGRDTVYLCRTERPVRKGDVILYRRENGSYVLHRVVCLHQGVLTCAGDNQFEPESVRPEQVIAYMVSFCRDGREYEVNSLGYRLWVWLWVSTFPVHKPILKLRRWLGKQRAKVKRHLV